MNMGVSQLLYMYIISLNNMTFNNNHEKLKHAKKINNMKTCNKLNGS